jgi:hypothetical protein
VLEERSTTTLPHSHRTWSLREERSKVVNRSGRTRVAEGDDRRRICNRFDDLESQQLSQKMAALLPLAFVLMSPKKRLYMILSD